MKNYVILALFGVIGTVFETRTFRPGAQRMLASASTYFKNMASKAKSIVDGGRSRELKKALQVAQARDKAALVYDRLSPEERQASKATLITTFQKKLAEISTFDDVLQYQAMQNAHNHFFSSSELYHLAMQSMRTNRTKLLTPTIAHLLNAGHSDAYSLYRSTITYARSPQLKAMVEQVILLEKLYQEKGYVTFVHGQRWKYNFYQQLHKDAQKEPWSDAYLSPHVRLAPLDDETELRKKIIKEGRGIAKPYGSEMDLEVRSKLLFLNMPFFGNSTNDGCSTAKYAYSNNNVNNISCDVSTILQMNNQDPKYGKWLKILEMLHSGCSDYGNLLFIAIPKDKVNDYVFSASSGGYKRTVMINSKQTDDVALIYDTLCTNPSAIFYGDAIEFCLVMTNDAGLNPQSGIVIQQLNAPSSRWKYSVFKYAYDLVIRNMKHNASPKQR